MDNEINYDSDAAEAYAQDVDNYFTSVEQAVGDISEIENAIRNNWEGEKAEEFINSLRENVRALSSKIEEEHANVGGSIQNSIDTFLEGENENVQVEIQ